MPTTCMSCDQPNDVQHALNCKRDGYVWKRHQAIVRTFEGLFKTVLTASQASVRVEAWLPNPPLAPAPPNANANVTQGLRRHPPSSSSSSSSLSANNQPHQATDDKYRVDIQVTGFEDETSVDDYDVVVFNPDSDAYRNKTLQTVFKERNEGKNRKYKAVCDVLNHRFTPLAMTTDGVMSNETTALVQKISKDLAGVWEKPVSVVTAWVRAKLALALVRSTSACIRGKRGRKDEWKWLNEHGFRDGAGVAQHLTAAAHDLDSQQEARVVERRIVNIGNDRRDDNGGWIGGHINQPLINRN